MKVRARITKTNKFREITLRKDPHQEDVPMTPSGLYKDVPCYFHSGRKTISGRARETTIDKWVFEPVGKYKNEI